MNSAALLDSRSNGTTSAGPLQRLLVASAGLGGLVFVLGLFVAPQRIWPGYLLAAVWLLHASLAGAFLLAILMTMRGRWADPILALPRAMAAALLPAAVALLILAFGISSLYEWSHAALMETDPILAGKAGWLHPGFFLGRLVITLVIWLVFAGLLTARNSPALSAAFIPVFAVTFFLSSVDLIQSLEPHWYSTVFGLYNFSGFFLHGCAVMALMAVIVRRRSRFVTDDQLHDIGRLVFAFSSFWAYIWFCQTMLIWYTDIPEETAYYLRRSSPAWTTLMLLNVALNWVVPFLVLLPRRMKRNDDVMFRVALVVIAGHWLDLYLMIFPASSGPHPNLGAWELAPSLAALAVFALVARKRLGPETATVDWRPGRDES